MKKLQRSQFADSLVEPIEGGGVKKFRWGILGSGFAARKFVLGLRLIKDAEVVLVASRSLQNAQEFARRFGIASAYGSYEDAVNVGDVDAYLLATPPNTHCNYALLCLNAGKPVLVEKPFTTSATEALEIIETAKERSVFCMEGMWTRFLPLVRRVKRLVEQGDIGEIRMLTGGFCIAEVVSADNNLFSLEHGGGAMLDRGVYLISLAFHLMGKPDEISSAAFIGKTGVDEDAAVILRYDNGGLALLNASLRTQAPNDCVIMGTRAQIHIQSPIYRPFRMTVSRVRERKTTQVRHIHLESIMESDLIHNTYQRFGRIASAILDRSTIHCTDRYAGNGYHYEAEEVMACVRDGRLESTIMPLAESLEIMEAMDKIRSQWAGCESLANSLMMTDVSQQ